MTRDVEECKHPDKIVRRTQFVFWLDALNKVFEDILAGTSDYKLAMVVRNIIANPEDKRHIQGMTVVTDIT